MVPYEYKIGEGKTVDVVTEKDGKRKAVEVETGKSDDAYNIKKDLKAGFNRIVSISTKKKKKKILQLLKQNNSMEMDKIMIIDLTSFYEK